jgi:hypothetical protein
VQPFPHALKQLAVALRQRAGFGLLLVQRSQRMGQKLRADAFAQHGAQRVVPTAFQQMFDGLHQMRLHLPAAQPEGGRAQDFADPIADRVVVRGVRLGQRQVDAAQPLAGTVDAGHSDRIAVGGADTALGDQRQVVVVADARLSLALEHDDGRKARRHDRGRFVVVMNQHVGHDQRQAGADGMFLDAAFGDADGVRVGASGLESGQLVAETVMAAQAVEVGDGESDCGEGGIQWRHSHGGLSPPDVGQGKRRGLNENSIYSH